MFQQYIGIDHSSAVTPVSSCKRLGVYAAERLLHTRTGSASPRSAAVYGTRRGLLPSGSAKNLRTWGGHPDPRWHRPRLLLPHRLIRPALRSAKLAELLGRFPEALTPEERQVEDFPNGLFRLERPCIAD